jgi:putative oxidoreductase
MSLAGSSTPLDSQDSSRDRGVASRWASAAPHLRSLLRVILGFLILQFGTAKLLGFPGTVLPGGATTPPGSLPGVAGILEIAGGVLLLVGLFTRPVAFVLSGEMAFAYFIGHAPNGFWPVLNQGSPAVLFCFVFLYLSSAGPGAWSLDGLRMRRTAGEPARAVSPP